MAHLHSTPSDKSASTAKPSSNFADKRGIRFNPHVTVQSESNTQWDLADSFNNLNIRDPNVHNRHGSQSDSSADSATVVTPIPSKDGEGDHTSNTTKDGSPFAPNFHSRSTRLPNGSGGFQYRQANGAVPAGRAEDIPPNEFSSLPRPFIPNNAPGGQRGGRPPASYGASQGVSPTINNPSIAPGVPFYPQVNPQAPYPGAGTGANLEGLPPNEAAAMIINNAIQQAVAIAGPLPGHGPGAPLNPAAIAAAYASPHLLGTIYSNPSMYGQTPGNAPFYQPRPNAGGESMQTPPPGLANFPSPGMAPLQQAGYSGQASNDSNTSPTSGNANGLGPSANNRKLGLYKTELCRSWEEKGSCRYGPKCQFAHGEDELRRVARHPKYKTEICRTFWVSGSCPYGKRCCFIHTELPPGGGAPGDEKNLPPAGAAPPPPPAPEGRPRSDSRNSDSDQQPSMLTRIKRNGSNQHSGASTPPGQFTEANTPGSASFGRGPLRVDTGVVDANTGPKEAYPFTSGPAMPGPGVPVVRTELPGRRSPGPVTAGPDFGRHTAAARLEVVGSNSSGGRPSGHLRSVSQTFPASSLEPSSGRHSPAGPGGHLRSDSWSAVSAFAAAPSSAIDPPSRFSERNWN